MNNFLVYLCRRFESFTHTCLKHLEQKKTRSNSTLLVELIAYFIGHHFSIRFARFIAGTKGIHETIPSCSILSQDMHFILRPSHFLDFFLDRSFPRHFRFSFSSLPLEIPDECLPWHLGCWLYHRVGYSSPFFSSPFFLKLSRSAFVAFYVLLP